MKSKHTHDCVFLGVKLVISISVMSRLAGHWSLGGIYGTLSSCGVTLKTAGKQLKTSLTNNHLVRDQHGLEFNADVD